MEPGESEITNVIIYNKLMEILEKIDNMEKTYVSINSDLITQNIKMCELINGKLKEPDFPVSNSGTDDKTDSSDNNKKKDLYYFEKNGKIVVYGPGTYDNRPILKQYGEWDGFNKAWNLIIEKEILLQKLPNIIEKEKIGNL
jgi:hypothetical protein